MVADLSHPCIDLSLKTRALFFSQQPFDVCQEAISLPASHGKPTPSTSSMQCSACSPCSRKALTEVSQFRLTNLREPTRRFMCAAATSAASGFAGSHDPSGGLPQRLQRALMTWQHPSAAMPAAAVAAVAASKQGAGFVGDRRELWKESFRSLYMAVQSGHCHCFYFVTAQVRQACLVELPSKCLTETQLWQLNNLHL